eukprot:TRINITY_DN556_c0_g2_i1.p2 TRINITY_DN556_c0_g2~~TRINITY_DN556_c0_g2_i1.p2  ORF type:complete len:274 (+),score=91.65 TRINITY_DN556_c0_g2_i1:26-847(+)
MEYIAEVVRRELSESQRWTMLCVCAISAVYLVLVALGRRLMRDRAAVIDSHNPRSFGAHLMVFHNGILCFASFLMVGWSFIWLFSEMPRKDLTEFVCDHNYHLFRGHLHIVALGFAVSKIYELLDTLYLILCKSEVRFLHVYHHAITLVLTWLGYTTEFPAGFWFGFTNGFVHIFVYYYYAIAVLGKTVWWKKHLTTVQIVQFVLMLGLICFCFWYGVSRGACDGVRPPSLIAYTTSLACYLSFLGLFIDLFMKIYGAGAKKNARRPVAKKHN